LSGGYPARPGHHEEWRGWSKATPDVSNYSRASYIYRGHLSSAIRYPEALRFGPVGISDSNPKTGCHALSPDQEERARTEGHERGLAEYLDARLISVSV
jgi:succinate-semialdehyde dehydrogenase/glutarate-semialdehyde dehydrogenase